MEANTCKDENIAIGFFNPVTFNFIAKKPGDL
jgi:hypothetical protein